MGADGEPRVLPGTIGADMTTPQSRRDASPARGPGPLHGSSSALSAAPVLYLSSRDAGWDGLAAQAFHEPNEYDGWITPATSDVSLILFAGGAMRIEQRHRNGAWKALQPPHHGEIRPPLLMQRASMPPRAVKGTNQWHLNSICSA